MAKSYRFGDDLPKTRNRKVDPNELDDEFDKLYNDTDDFIEHTKSVFLRLRDEESFD